MTDLSLPEALNIFLEKAALSPLVKSREILSDKYRKSGLLDYMTSDAERLSYLATRMPATYAAIKKVFSLIFSHHTFSIKSLLDLGAGPMTALWATEEYLLEIKEAHCIERDVSLIEMGKKLWQLKDGKGLQNITWKASDMSSLENFPFADLVILSYSIGELSAALRDEVIARAFLAAKELFVVIEPGTPDGFKRVATVRDQVIALGGHMVAPCPHAHQCPIQKGDWCHFSVRLNRSSSHRFVKGADLGYEDEKFSFVAFSKKAQQPSLARIIRRPENHTGHVKLSLCTEEGLKECIVSKKMKETYRLAKKASWGDSFPIPS